MHTEPQGHLLQLIDGSSVHEVGIAIQDVVDRVQGLHNLQCMALQLGGVLLDRSALQRHQVRNQSSSVGGLDPVPH